MKKIKDNKEERILNSLEGIRPADAPDFFYSRLLAKMERSVEHNDQRFFLLSPAFLTVASTIILAINIFFIFQYKNSSGSTIKNATIESFAQDYNLQGYSVFQ